MIGAMASWFGTFATNEWVNRWPWYRQAREWLLEHGYATWSSPAMQLYSKSPDVILHLVAGVVIGVVGYPRWTSRTLLFCVGYLLARHGMVAVQMAESRIRYGASISSGQAARVLLDVATWDLAMVPLALVTAWLVARPHLRREERRRRGACMACGFDLTGNASGVCPECGATTRERLGLPG